MPDNHGIQLERSHLIRLGCPLARIFTVLLGWRLVGQPPDEDKYVIIGAPHTSNWDFMLLLHVICRHQLSVHWMAKDSLFFWPFARIHRMLGGIAIDRSRQSNTVEQVAAAYQQHDSLTILIPPEGTRSYRPFWKSGFYYITLAADVPLVLGFVDASKKEFGFGPTIELTGDVCVDMDRIRIFYADKIGLRPGEESVIRLRQEDEEKTPHD